METLPLPARVPSHEKEAPGSAQRLALLLGCPESIALLLVARGVHDEAAARAFFDPTLEDLGDPLGLRGMSEAVQRILRALRHSEAILIYGDYDVDGTTATALLKKALELAAPPETPAIVSYHVPHRLREGYGMQTGVLTDAVTAGIRLIISVDTGIRAFAAAAHARLHGLDLIVTDHHLPDAAGGVPHALAVINPAQDGCGYGFASLCGAAVAFKLAHAVLRASARDAAALAKIEKVIVPSLLKLVAVATIADSVPLEGENRALASLGLRFLAAPVQPGLRALFASARIAPGKAPTPAQIAFRLAPRINAAGRMDIAGDVVELLLTRDAAHATTLAGKLDRLNVERRATETAALESIERKLEAMRQEDGGLRARCIVLDEIGWHRGVLGILASRVVEKTARPTLILTHEDGEAHGSGRSVPGFHLLDAVTAVDAQYGARAGGGEASLFSRFGGHAHAIGFALPSCRVEHLRAGLEEYASSLLPLQPAPGALAHHAQLPFDQVTLQLFEWVMRLAPFGIGNAEPLFLSRGVRVLREPRIVQEKHLRLTLAAGMTSVPQDAMAWGHSVAWGRRCEALGLTRGSAVDVLFRLREKTDRNFGVYEIDIVDLQPSSVGDI